MGWRLKQHKRTKRWRIWSTITDSYCTDWLTEEELKAELASHYEEEYKLQVIEVYMAFPHGWTDKDSYKRLENLDAVKAFYSWKEQALRSEDYAGEIDRKFREITGREQESGRG